MPTKKKVAKKITKSKSQPRGKMVQKKAKKEEPIPTPFSVAPSSPVRVVVTEKFSFPQAMDHIINNKKVRRAEWPEMEFACLHNGFLHIFRVKEGENAPAYHMWQIGDGDMLESDWMIV